MDSQDWKLVKYAAALGRITLNANGTYHNGMMEMHTRSIDAYFWS